MRTQVSPAATRHRSFQFRCHILILSARGLSLADASGTRTRALIDARDGRGQVMLLGGTGFDHTVHHRCSPEAGTPALDLWTGVHDSLRRIGDHCDIGAD